MLHLIKKVDLENVLDLLLLAEKYKERELKKTAMTFLLKNIKSILKTEMWKKVPKNLMTEIMQLLVNGKRGEIIGSYGYVNNFNGN